MNLPPVANTSDIAMAIREASKTFNASLEILSKAADEVCKTRQQAEEQLKQPKKMTVTKTPHPEIELEEFNISDAESPMYRFNYKGSRYYFVVRYGKIRLYSNVTNIIHKTMVSEGLNKLMKEKGSEYDEWMYRLSHYGRLLHILIAEYAQSGNKDTRTFDFDAIPSKILQYIAEEHINFDTHSWRWEIEKDMASIIAFFWQHNVEPIKVEAMGYYEDLDGIAFGGALDLLCWMDIEEKGFFGEIYKSGERKGEPKESKQMRRVKALVDFKSGKSGFFDEYAIQLAMYGMIAEQCYGEKVEKLINVAPMRWTGNVPTYSMKDQTDNPIIDMLPLLLRQFNYLFEPVTEIKVFPHTVNGAGDPADLIRIVPIEQYLLDRLGISKKESITGEEPLQEEAVEEVASEHLVEEVASEHLVEEVASEHLVEEVASEKIEGVEATKEKVRQALLAKKKPQVIDFTH